MRLSISNGVKLLTAGNSRRNRATDCPRFNQLLQINSIGKRLVASNDPSIPQRIEAFMLSGDTSHLAVEGDHQQIVRIVHNGHPVFVTPEEASIFLDLGRGSEVESNVPVPVRQVRKCLGSEKTSAIRPIGGLITGGSFTATIGCGLNAPLLLIFGAKSSESIRVPLSRFLSSRNYPRTITVEVQGGNLVLKQADGLFITTVASNRPNGLSIATLKAFLSSIKMLVGQITRMVSPRGELNVGTETILLPAYKKQAVRLEFDHGHFVVKDATETVLTEFDCTGDTAPHSTRVSATEAVNFTGAINRTTNAEGFFEIGRRRFCLGAEWSRTSFLVTLENGKITRLFDCKRGLEINLGELHFTHAFNATGEIVFSISAATHLRKSHFAGFSGWVKAEIDKPEDGGRWNFCRREIKLESGYESIFLYTESGIVLQIAYFDSPNAAPWNTEAANLTTYKRFYSQVEGTYVLIDSFIQLQKELSDKLTTGKHRITDWPIDINGMIHINNHHVYFSNQFTGFSLTLDFEDGIVTYAVESIPAITGRFVYATGEKIK